jgi:hypothetical protein
MTHVLLGTICAKRGRHDEAVTAFRRVTELESVLLPGDQQLGQELAAVGRREEAVAVLQTAADREPNNPWYPLEMGEILRSQGKSEEAAKAFRKAADHAPGLASPREGLAAVLLALGRFAEARGVIESLLAIHATDAERRARRRQLDLCDSMIAVEPKLPAILAGRERPTDVPTLRALAEWCLKHKRLTATAAGFYDAAFSAQPSLADDLEAADRLNAACAAALAGCGVGEDAADLGGERRAALRKQALDWLTADCNAWGERHRLGRPGDRTVAATALRSWQRNEDLAGVRDEQALAKLPAEERRAWQALWEKATTLAARDPAAKFDQAQAHVARLE